MKKYFALTAVAVLALAACTKLENPGMENQENNGSLKEVGFNVVAQKATKAGDADILTGTTFTIYRTFKVWGFKSKEDGNFDKTATSTSDFMTGLKIEYTKGADADNHELAWRNAEHYYYWPYTGKIGFYAAAPSSLTPNVTWGSMVFTDYTISSTNQTVDVLYGYAVDGSRTTALPLVFNHALSQVVYNIKTNEDYSSDVKFEVTKVEFENVDLSGTFTYSATAATPSAAWTANTTQSEKFTYYATATEATAAGVAYGSALLQIPQAVSTDGTKMNISYKLTNKGDNTYVEGTVSKPISGTTKADGAAVSSWEMGKRYIYTLVFKLNEITFAPEVTSWVDVNLVEITIP